MDGGCLYVLVYRAAELRQCSFDSRRVIRIAPFALQEQQIFC